MKNKKLLKVLVSTGGLISLSATTGTILNNFSHSNIHNATKAPKPNLGQIQKDQQLKNNINNNYNANLKDDAYNSSWAAFQENVHKEQPVSIINSTRLISWAFASNVDLDIIHIDSNTNNHTMNLYMEHNDNGNYSRAVFQIKYENKAYDISGWKCIVLPVKTTKVNYSDWSKFITKASSANKDEIFSAAKPATWDLKNTKNLVASNPRVDYLNSSVSIDLVYDNNGVFERATFTADYSIDASYNATDWHLVGKPHVVTNNWTDIKTAFTNELTPNNVLNEAQPWLSYNQHRLNWVHGGFSQRFWQYNNNANWDIFGAIAKTDAYQGMAGKPIFKNLDNGKVEISAIISKKGHGYNYDSDPIKATFDFLPGDVLNFSNWNFKKTTQLESVHAFKSALHYDDWDMLYHTNDSSRAVDFAKRNYFINKGDPNAILRYQAVQHSVNILQTLSREGQTPTDGHFSVERSGSGTSDLKSQNGKKIIGISPYLEFGFQVSFFTSYNLFLNMPTYFVGNDASNGIVSFNDEWKGITVMKL